MVFLHLSDLHLGKRLNEFSLLEDQKYILEEILKITDREKPDSVIIAGDIYDKAVPPTEAVELFDDFLVSLANRSLSVFAVSGNHDSPQRIAFGARLMSKSNIHLSPVYSGTVKPTRLRDEYGWVNLYLLPFIKPVNVRRFFPDREIESYSDAVAAAIEQMGVDSCERNVLVAHQFVTGASTAGSEELLVGGSENVDASIFSPFDYVALGHIHRPQNVGSENIRYCGTPLKYSFSEVSQKKSVTIVELGAKGEVLVRTVGLNPLRDLREIKGSYNQLAALEYYKDSNTGDYLGVTLTDEQDVPNALAKLRVIYPNIMKLDYDNARTRARAFSELPDQKTAASPLELFSDFYLKQNGSPMTEQQNRLCGEIIEKIWQEEEK